MADGGTGTGTGTGVVGGVGAYVPGGTERRASQIAGAQGGYPSLARRTIRDRTSRSGARGEAACHVVELQ
jgi:hypothetical protein